MHWLLFGANGWIGTQVYNYLVQQKHQVTPVTANLQTSEDVKRIFQNIHGIDRVFIAIGRTCLPPHRIPENYQNNGIKGTIDDLEHPSVLHINLRDNIYLPIIIAEECVLRAIHCSYLGTGCIYEYDEAHPLNGTGFSETDLPNFTGSSYSIAKSLTDQWFANYRKDHILNLRIRMPITDTWNPRNFLYKILKYDTIVSIPNTMSILPELIPLALQCAESKLTGTLNLVNPEPMSHRYILDLIAKIWDIKLKCKFTENQDDIKAITCSRRSNNNLEAGKLVSLFPNRVSRLSAGLQSILHRWKPTASELAELGYF